MERTFRDFFNHLASLEEAVGADNGFSKEFKSIKKHLASISDWSALSAETGRARENAKKNRYKDILPFDQTRVSLKLLLNEGYSDYINANFIRGVDGERYYIATQGPLPQTVVDFWRMVWEFDVKVIVMACREFELGKKKCERYWALEGEGTVVFGPFTVTSVSVKNVSDEVTIRTLSVTMLDEVGARTVQHFQYTAWPDHGIPHNFQNLLDMLELIHQRQGQLRAPICVHCSAGCGRTGVICTVDYIRSLLLRKAIGEGFSIQDIVREMRQQRPAAVQTKDQYEFIYRFVAEMFQKELARGLHDHQNLAKEPRASHSQHLSQPPLSKPLISPKPLSASSLPELGPRPPAAKSMPREGPANETYAAVARTKTGAGGVLVPPKASPPPARPAVGCAYENLAPVGQPALEALLYSTVIVKDMPRPAKPRSHPEAPPKAKETHSSPAAISYAMIDFGPAGLDPQGSPATSSDVASEYWAPTLPERTADSYVVLDADESGASSYSSNHENNKRSSNLSNVFKLGHPGNAARNASVATDDSYEDVSGASSPVVSRFSSSNGLGFNSRVSKPKGPRPCPEAWALYGQ